MDARALGLAAAVTVATAALTAAWIAVAKRWRVQDLPGQRRLHAIPTPRGGGIAIALAWGGAFVLLALAADTPPVLAFLLPLGSCVLAFAGLFDDLVPQVHASTKLVLQACGALAIAVALLPLGSWPGWALATLAGVALLNSWNFMDGSNGMVAIQSLLIATALALWPGQDAPVATAALALAASCLGFLPFNFPKARVFLGDVGSHVLGGAIFILLGWSLCLGTLGWTSALLLLTPMLLDAGLTLARRVLRGRRFWKAHREHLYQYAVRMGHSHASVALAYAGATMLAWLLALAGRNQPMTVAVCLLVLAWLGGAVLHAGLRSRWLDRSIRNGSQG